MQSCPIGYSSCESQALILRNILQAAVSLTLSFEISFVFLQSSMDYLL